MSELPELPGHVILRPPPTPRLEMAPPDTASIRVVPVRGRPGPAGPAGSTVDVELVQGLIDTTVSVHVNDPTPHPAYDDIPTLTLLFENRLV